MYALFICKGKHCTVAGTLRSALAAAENCHLKRQTLKVNVSFTYSCIFQVVSSLWVFQLEICMHFSSL